MSDVNDNSLRPVPELLAALTGRTYWSECDAAPFLEHWRRSGKTLHQFCCDTGVPYHRLYRLWRRAEGGDNTKRRAESALAPRFLPARVKPSAVDVRPVSIGAPRRASGSPMEVVLSSGHIVRVADGFDAAEVCRLISALEAMRC